MGKATRRCCIGMKPKNFIVSYKSVNRWRWKMLNIVLSIYNAVYIPCLFSFAIDYQFL